MENKSAKGVYGIVTAYPDADKIPDAEVTVLAKKVYCRYARRFASVRDYGGAPRCHTVSYL